MTITALLIFSGALIADSISPGPTVAALIARVLSRGVSGVLPFMLAIWLGEALWLTAAVAGLAALAATFSLLFAIVKWLGVAYLFYLAWTLFTASPETEQGGDSARSSSTATFLSGLSVALGNPKNMVFYLTLLPSIIDMEDISAVGVATTCANAAGNVDGSRSHLDAAGSKSWTVPQEYPRCSTDQSDKRRRYGARCDSNRRSLTPREGIPAKHLKRTSAIDASSLQ